MAPNGEGDATFPTNRFLSNIVLPSGPTAKLVAKHICVDTQDRIVLGAQAQNIPNSDIFVIRLTTSGQLDLAFDGDGVQTVNVNANGSFARTITTDSYNNVIVASETQLPNRSTETPVLAKITTFGAIDRSFGSNGVAVLDISNQTSSIQRVIVDAQGRYS